MASAEAALRPGRSAGGALPRVQAMQSGGGFTSGLGPEGGLDGPACAIAQGWAARGWRCRLGLL